MDTNQVNSNLFDNYDTVYYGVYVPQEDSYWLQSRDELHVYTDKSEALNVVKKYQKGRFKSFKTYKEAQVFAEHGNEQTITDGKEAQPVVTKKNNSVEEKSSNFKAPKHQDTVRFRKLIESGKLDSVKQVVWENPRYLISSGDTPAILQEGSRYNALHVAVRVACRADMCELILETVGNPDFVRLLDGDDDCSNYLNRAQILVDLYLNTPDKGLNETPLHFAVKFGLKEIVKVFVSYPQCLKTLRNKYNQIPADIICSRKCQEDETLKKEILSLLDEQFYVPVLRSEDNTMQPLIGELFSPTSPLKFNYNPISPKIEVSAYAGPMTKNQAVEFRKKWKTPPRIRSTPTKRYNISIDDSYYTNSPASNVTYRLQDTEKGLERVGRDLAKEYHVDWKEYWPFLEGYADLASEEGLSKLERFFEQRFNSQQNIEIMKTAELMNGNDPDSNCELNALCTKLSSSSFDMPNNQESNEFVSTKKRLFRDMNDSDDEDEYFTPPSSLSSSLNSSEEEMYTAVQSALTFIKGDKVTKLDYAVYHAVSSVDLSPNSYPYIYRWQHQLKLIMANESSRSDTPIVTRRRLILSPLENCIKSLHFE